MSSSIPPAEGESRLLQLFSIAVERRGAALKQLLDEVRRTEPEVHALLLELLEADERNRDRAEPIALPGIGSLLDGIHVAQPAIGDRVGPFRIDAEIGAGGSGRVFRASRTDGQVDQRVAIKLLRDALFDEEHRRRFAQERRTLAGLEHPNIARLIDVGETTSGAPFLVMEFVDGDNLVRHCEQIQATVPQRVRLVMTICQAVSHAHRRLVIHRDIKPGNILVTAEGEPKLLDFGIAKALTQSGADTAAVARMLTPGYAAPEQWLGQAPGVGIDIYALGAVLFELLAGAPPFRFDGLSPGQIERLLLDTAAPLPSAVAAAGPPQVATRSRLLRGDLDAIVLRCLRKAPEDRYLSAEQLEADLGRYLSGHPVSARGGHRGYRLRKFLGRHRAAASIAAGASVALVLGGIGWWRETEATRVQRDHAQATVAFLQRAFSAADPARNSGGTVTARQILDAAQRRLDEVEQVDPALFALLGTAIAETQLAVGETPQATDLGARAVAAAARGRLPDIDHAGVRLSYARSLLRQERFDEARDALRAVAAMGFSDSLDYQVLDGRLKTLTGDVAAAIIELRDRVARHADLGPTSDVANSLRWQLIDSLRSDARYAEALAAADAMLAWQSTALDAGHPNRLLTEVRRIDLLRKTGHATDAVSAAQRLSGLVARLYGPASSFTATVLNAHAGALLATGNVPSATEQFAAALEASRLSLGADHANTLRTHYNLADATARLPDRQAEATRLFEALLPRMADRYGANDEMTIMTRLRFGEHLEQSGRAGAALRLLSLPEVETVDQLAGTLNRTEYLDTLARLLSSPACADPRAIEPEGVTACERARHWLAARAAGSAAAPPSVVN